MSAASDLHPDLQALIGTVIHDRYRVDRLLGAGGMGAVFKAHHLGLRRDVALKVLRPELGRDPSTGKRFEREAHSVSRLDHPNCVRVTDFGTTEGGVKYLVMELLDGAELEASLGQPWAPARAVDTIMQILEGLEHAHAVAVVHRDLKPENVFVTKDYRGHELVKLVDFGIAKLIDEQGVKDQLTRAGTIFGTPRYMSPEQASGGKLDERTDLYAAGLILYEMLTGRPPFVADDAAALLRMHILAPPPELPPSVPAPLAAIVNKLLEKSRNDRYASARETITALQQIRPQLDGAAAAVITSPVMTGPSATPSMATSFEGSTGLSWAPAAPLSAASGPGASIPSGPLAAPAMPGMPAAVQVPAAVPAPVPAPPVPAPLGLQPNAPTHGVVAPEHPSVAVTHYDPHPATQPPPPSRSWTKWAVVGGAIMLALMAFGAGQALNSGGDDASPRASTGSEPAPRDEAVPSTLTGREFDDDCSDGVCECRDQASCEIECGRGCQLRCIDTDRCELEVGSDSTVLCERVGKCEVRCTGDCRVECPQGGCEVTCPPSGKSDDKKDDKKDDKHEKKRRPKPAKRCGDVYVCGGDCDDDDDDD